MSLHSEPLTRLVLFASLVASSPAAASEPVGLHAALNKLAFEDTFSGAVVIRGPEGVRFARGYGWSDPVERRPFTPDTQVDSASLAKPITAAAVLFLIREGKVAIDAPVQRYLAEFPHRTTSVRHLLSHSAGLSLEETPEGLANKSNADLLKASGPPMFAPGGAFSYCNMCFVTLAMLIERVAGIHYLDFVKQFVGVPDGVSLRPQRLADWGGRSIGYRKADDKFDRFDSWEGELLYGPANFSLSAAQLAHWGSQWWQSRLRPIRQPATSPARIGPNMSGLTLGNWYCASTGRQCHYIGHHEGFHHMLYWDVDRRISVAMVTNNAMRATLHQPLQRALVAFAEGRLSAARRELAAEPADVPVPIGLFELPTGEKVGIVAEGLKVKLERRSVAYDAFRVGTGVRYVPRLDLYLAGHPKGSIRWISLYEDSVGRPAPVSGR